MAKLKIKAEYSQDSNVATHKQRSFFWPAAAILVIDKVIHLWVYQRT